MPPPNKKVFCSECKFNTTNLREHYCSKITTVNIPDSFYERARTIQVGLTQGVINSNNDCPHYVVKGI